MEDLQLPASVYHRRFQKFIGQPAIQILLIEKYGKAVGDRRYDQGVMTFIGNWNSYLTPLIILNDKKKMTLPLMIATVRDSTHADYGAQYVGMLVSVIPMVIVFCFASRIIMEKISIGAAVKG